MTVSRPLALALVATVAGCRLVSLPPASSRSDGGPVAARGTISHEARSQVRLYRDAAGCESVQTVNRRFRVVTVTRRDGPARLVLEEASDVRECLETAASSSELTVTAWRPDSSVTEPLFRIKARAARGLPAGNLYRLVGHGCCGSGELASYFSLLTGRALFGASAPLLEVHDSAAGDRRFAAVHDSHSAGAPPETVADSAVVGVLQWGDDREPARRYAISISDPEPFAVTEVTFVRGGRPLTDSVIPASSGGGELLLRVRLAAPGSGRSIEVGVPVVGLDLAPDRARVTGGAALRPVE